MRLEELEQKREWGAGAQTHAPAWKRLGFRKPSDLLVAAVPAQQTTSGKAG